MSIFINSLKEKGRLNSVSITVCIVGSRKILSKEAYGYGGWDIFAPNLTIYGFDADEEACDAANQDLESKNINWTEKHIPLALSNSTGEATLYVTQAVHCSSLYPPNEDFMKRFMGMEKGIQLDFSIEIETTTLDEFLTTNEIQEIDFLQVDVQGADLDVLKGASEVLKRSVLGLQVEVEFSSMYLNQPLFSELDVYLRKEGFVLFDLMMNDPWCRRPRSRSPIYSSTRPGQLLWADALYLRDPLIENASALMKSPEQVFKLACVADVLGFPDYTLELLEYLTIHYGENPEYNFAQDILNVLSQFPELVKQGLDSFSVVANMRDRLP